MSQSSIPSTNIPIASARPSLLARSVGVMKPVTWFAPAWAFLCGTIASGAAQWSVGHVGRIALGALLCGPIVCGLGQVINDYCDRDVDALNEPNRLIPSGLISTRQVLATIAVLTALAFALALLLGRAVTLLTAIGLILAVLYSVPPVRAKRNGWLGNTLVAVSYEGLPWIAGQLAFASWGWRSATIAALVSFGTIGIMAINDFKSMDGDRTLGIRTLPVMYGAWGAAWLIVLIMSIAQVWMVLLFAVWGEWLVAAIIAGALVAQLPLQRRFLRDPITHAIVYSAGSSGLFVLGMLAAAIGVRG